MPSLPSLTSACPRSYGSIGNVGSQWQEALPNTRFHDDDEESHRYSKSGDGSTLSFMSNQASNRNTRVFGGVVASLAVCCVMVGLFNTSPSTSTAVATGTEGGDKLSRMARSGRYLVVTDQDVKKGDKPEEVKTVSQNRKEAKVEKKPAEAKPTESKPAERKPAERKPAERKPAEKEPVESRKEPEEKPANKPAESKKAKVTGESASEDRATQSYEKAARHHMAAASHYEKLAEDIEKKAARVEKQADEAYGHAIKEAKEMEDQADATAKAELKQVRANKKLLNSKWAAKFEDPTNWV